MENFEKFYKELNIDQKKAVDAVEGPVLVLAGPGTSENQGNLREKIRKAASGNAATR